MLFFGRITMSCCLLCGLVVCSSFVVAAEPSISPAVVNSEGILIHEVVSPFQAGSTQIKVLLPDHLKSNVRYPVVYLLPVEPGNQTRYGDGMEEVRRHDLHNKHRAIFVAPTFSHLPWYADHPTDPAIRQESYFLQVVVPWIDKTYPVIENADGRLLLGFSKSGWGAWSLLLRHPERFGQAAAWDAPLNKAQPNQFGMGPIFGTQEQFEQYQISTLLHHRAARLKNRGRLILLGYGSFRDQHQAVHALMEKLEIPHIYRDGPERKHDWHSGWVAEAAELLLVNINDQ